MVALIGLLTMELPGETLRLCDGGFMAWGANTYLSEHETFGAVQSVEALSEGTGDEIPALAMTFIPASDAAAGDLSQPGYQKSRVQFHIAEFDPEAGTLVGSPELQFDGQIDQTKLVFGRGTRALEMEIVSSAERLFMKNEGNSLNAAWHKLIWSGELGHDEATGMTIAVAWGVEAPPSVGGSSSALAGTWWNP